MTLDSGNWHYLPGMDPEVQSAVDLLRNRLGVAPVRAHGDRWWWCYDQRTLRGVRLVASFASERALIYMAQGIRTEEAARQYQHFWERWSIER